MDWKLLDLISADTIATGIAAKDFAQAIIKINNLLVKRQFTQPEFAADCIAREKAFPTGLPTEPVKVALPHSDPAHVNKTGIAIGILKKPVSFGQMGTDGSEKVPVKIVFLMAIKEQSKQVTLLQQLISLIQSPSLLTEMANAPTSAEIYKTLRKSLNSNEA